MLFLKFIHRLVLYSLVTSLLVDPSAAARPASLKITASNQKQNQSLYLEQALASLATVPFRGTLHALKETFGMIRQFRSLSENVGSFLITLGGIFMMNFGVAYFIRDTTVLHPTLGYSTAVFAPLWYRNFLMTGIVVLLAWMPYRSWGWRRIFDAIRTKEIDISTSLFQSRIKVIKLIPIVGFIYVVLSTGLNFWSFSYMSKHISGIINGSSPGIVLLISAFLYRKGHARHRPVKWGVAVGVLALFVSLVAAVFYGLKWEGSAKTLGLTLSSISAVAWGLYQMAIPVICNTETQIPRMPVLAGVAVTGLMGLTPIRYFMAPDVPWFLFSIIGWKDSLILAGCLAGGLYIFSWGLERLQNPSLGAIIGSASSVSLSLSMAGLNVGPFPRGQWWIYLLNMGGIILAFWNSSPSAVRTPAWAA